MSNEVDRTLWVGNLHERVTEEILYELFLQAGPLERVAIPKDRDGKLKNFAFVTFEHVSSVPYTIELLNQTPLYGSPLKIQSRQGSVHQQPQQQHQQQLSRQQRQQQQQQSWKQNQNPYQNMPQNGNPYQGNHPSMKPYRSTQPVRNQGQTMSNMAANPYQANQPRGSPQLHKSNTWHGNDLKDVGQGREGSEGDRNMYNRRNKDRDRSGDRQGVRGRLNDYHSGRSENKNSPLRQDDNYSNGRNSPQESQRDRLLRMQQASLNAYRQGQNSRSNTGQNQPWQSRPYDKRRGRY